MKLSLIQLAVCTVSVGAFAPLSKKGTVSLSSSTKMSMVEDSSTESSRRSFFNKVVGSAAIAGVSLLQAPFPANAIGGGIKKVNAKLVRYVWWDAVSVALNRFLWYFCTWMTKQYCFHIGYVSFGLPTIDKVPDGFSPLAEVWGKGANRDPLMVSFNHPSDW